jgi:hypothetical protein
VQLVQGVCRCLMRRADGSTHDYTATHTYEAPVPLSAATRAELELRGRQATLEWAQREDEWPVTTLMWTWTIVGEPDVQSPPPGRAREG